MILLGHRLPDCIFDVAACEWPAALRQRHFVGDLQDASPILPFEPRPELAPCELVAVGAAALDGDRREVAQAVLVVGRILLGLLSAGRGEMLGVLHVEVEDLDALEAVGAVDAALQVAGDRALRSERRELADRADEVVDAVRAVVVLAQAVAEGELVDPVLNLGEVLRQAGAERIEVHDDEAPVGVRIVREGVDGVAERRVVDEAAVPIRRPADLDPRKLRRQASARQDMPGLDLADVVGFALRRRPVLALSRLRKRVSTPETTSTAVTTNVVGLALRALKST